MKSPADEIFGFALKRSKLYEQIADRLQELIISDSLRPGDKLPGERELAERLGVSRAVIREAIRVLSVRGLVRVKPGCGTYVCELSHKDAAASIELFLKLRQHPRFWQDIYEVRRMIEVEAAGLAAERATEQDLTAMEEALAGMEANRDDPERYTHYDIAFHMALATATHNELLGVLLRPLSDLLAEVVLVAYRAPMAVEEGLAHHRNILKRVREHDVAGARQAMRDHLHHAQESVEAARRQSREMS